MEEKETTPVCKYYLMGACRIRNCHFLHSTSAPAAICTYWLRGHCMRGSKCAFQHSLDTILDSTPLQIQQPKAQPNLLQHPTYRPIHASASLPAATQQSPLAAKLKLEQLTAAFSQIHPNLARDQMEACGGNYDQAFAALAQRFGPPASPQTPIVAQPLRAPVQTASIPSSGTLPWLETGSEVSAVYRSAREEAEEQCRLRNVLLMRATEAYRAGDGRRAKELSRQGREADRKAKELHAKAADQIASTRNAALQSHSGSNEVVDVHGLHPDEAVELVEAKIGALRRFPTGTRFLDVVTGTGHHSARHLKLKPAVEAYLVASNHKFRELDAGGRGGVLRVQLHPL